MGLPLYRTYKELVDKYGQEEADRMRADAEERYKRLTEQAKAGQVNEKVNQATNNLCKLASSITKGDYSEAKCSLLFKGWVDKIEDTASRCGYTDLFHLLTELGGDIQQVEKKITAKVSEESDEYDEFSDRLIEYEDILFQVITETLQESCGCRQQ